MDAKARIRELMAERKWSEYRLAIASGLSQSTVANIFNRNTTPSIATLESICAGFGITLGPVLRRRRYGGTDGGTKGNVCRVEFPFQRPEGRFAAVDPCNEGAILKGFQKCFYFIILETLSGNIPRANKNRLREISLS